MLCVYQRLKSDFIVRKFKATSWKDEIKFSSWIIHAIIDDITLTSKARKGIIMSDGLARNFLPHLTLFSELQGCESCEWMKKSNNVLKRLWKAVDVCTWRDFAFFVSNIGKEFEYHSHLNELFKQISHETFPSIHFNFNLFPPYAEHTRNLNLQTFMTGFTFVFIQCSHSIISRHTSNRLATRSAHIFFRTIRLWNWHEQRIKHQLTKLFKQV